ncbi:TolC family protein [Desulfitobacterium sp.]|uniref:TolC family protein n=1 Tax=Desulfitobacterium sp. TaxID=49981 RepID=UPI002B1F824A|nr:TolC family protein [Desulfitobacterium sp.]MEA4902193.1 TolC family protein [Desulfitobacterium sp.]
MKKKSLSVCALVLTASLAGSILFSTPNTWAADGAAQSSADTTVNLAPENSSSPDSTTNTSSEDTKTPADSSTLNLSLEDALKMVETGNSELQLLDSKISIYDKQNQQALARRAKVAISDENSKKDHDLNYRRTQWTLDNAKHDRDTKLKDLKAEITNQYESILALQQRAANLNKQHGDLETMIKQTNLQIELGLQIPSSIYPYNAQKAQIEAGQKLVANSIKSAMNIIKKDLGVDLDREVVLTSKLGEYTKYDDSDVDNKIAQAVNKNYDIQRYTQDIEITQIEYNIDFYYDDSNADTVEASIEDKKAALKDLPVTKEVELRTVYNSLKTLEHKIVADQLTLEADQINIDTMQKKIDAGQSSSLEIIPLQSTLYTDQYTLDQDIVTYNKVVAEFKNSLEK